jgi:UDP-2-acetamido-3-amino-2,3-dideoxy-glucuronate N-acetyltransferase
MSEVSQDYFVHESSYVDSGACVGAGTKIWHFCHLMPGAVVGRSCSLGQNVFVGSNVVIGNNVKIQNNVSIYDNVTLEDDVFCGPSMVFTNVINPRSHVSRKDEYRNTLVQRGASIGANATIVCGHTIGSYAFIGAGSVVTSDVPSFALVYGNPARQHGYVCRCGVKLDLCHNARACIACHLQYRLCHGGIVLVTPPR